MNSYLNLTMFMALFVGIVFSATVPPLKENKALDVIKENVQDLMKLVSVDKIKEITEKHMKTDLEFQAGIKYLQSQEWKDVVNAVKSKPEYVEFENYLAGLGINITALMRCVSNFTETAKIETEIPPGTKKNFRSFMDDIEATLPLAKMLALLNEKLIKNPDFQKLYDHLSNEESFKMVEKVRALPEVKKMVEILEDMGLKINETFTVMYTFFGWEEKN